MHSRTTYRPLHSVCHNDSNNDTEKTKSWSKNLDDEHRNECGWSLGVSEGSAWSDATDWEAAAQVWHANDKSNSENIVCSVFSLLPVVPVVPDVQVNCSEFVLENNCNNDAINCNGFAEDNWNQVLWNNTLHLDCWADDWDSSGPDAPKSMLR